MTELRFTVPGPPVAKARPRSGRTRDGRHITYTEARTSSWEDTCAWYARREAQGQRWSEGPVAVEVVAVLPRPKRLPKRGPQGEVLAPVRPDLDNLVKAVLDGINRAGVWGDDGQVVEVAARKVYAARDAGPEVRVRVRGVEGR